jgi:L-alanine-DL-glutamate epimerase-like enolase superfamily enzyme
MTGTVRASEAVVEAVEASAFTVPTDRPEADGTLAWSATTLVLVQAHSGGVVGTGWTYAPAAGVRVVHDLLAPAVTGATAMRTGAAWTAMVDAVRNAGRRGLVGYALSAVDVALWDLKARLLDLPLHLLLGAVREEVPVYGSGGFTTYDEVELRAQLGHWAHEQRIPRVKIKVGEDAGGAPERDLRRMRQAREVVGPDVELYVDANGGWTVKQAVRLMEAAADLDVRWLEEPVSSDDVAGLAEVRRLVRADVAAGEYGDDLPDLARLCRAGAVDCLQVDASRCGGLTEWQRAAALAAAHGLEVSGHCAPHLHVAVAAATPNLRHLEWFHDHVRLESLCFDGVLDPAGGEVRPRPNAPGHGLTVRWRDIDEHRVA